MHNVLFPTFLMFMLFPMLTTLASQTIHKIYFETLQCLQLMNVVFHLWYT